IAFDNGGAMYLSLDAYIAVSFTGRIFNDLLGKRRDRNRLGSHGRRIRFRSVHFEQRGNQLRSSVISWHSSTSSSTRRIAHSLRDGVESVDWSVDVIRPVFHSF